MSKPKELASADYIARGILSGGALGVFSALFGFTRSIFWSCGLGMLAGFMAGITLALRRGRPT
ncbi:MAG: hypothetical protein LBD82_00800 [Deltaproteobacteria bacterium]|jgi:hypothetical protein|nr:hypothetical protein [Deltaproteobacteria bacterium]